jgi:hypothetical protein
MLRERKEEGRRQIKNKRRCEEREEETKEGKK